MNPDDGALEVAEEGSLAGLPSVLLELPGVMTGIEVDGPVLSGTENVEVS